MQKKKKKPRELDLFQMRYFLYVFVRDTLVSVLWKHFIIIVRTNDRRLRVEFDCFSTVSIIMQRSIYRIKFSPKSLMFGIKSVRFFLFFVRSKHRFFYSD